jgi:hypothetical protein
MLQILLPQVGKWLAVFDQSGDLLLRRLIPLIEEEGFGQVLAAPA